jgi:hypothetical protein
MAPPVVRWRFLPPGATPTRAASAAFAANPTAAGIPCSHITQIITGHSRLIAVISMIVVNIFPW